MVVASEVERRQNILRTSHVVEVACEPSGVVVAVNDSKHKLGAWVVDVVYQAFDSKCS